MTVRYSSVNKIKFIRRVYFMKKRIMALVMAAAMAASLAGCGGGQTQKAEPAAASGEAKAPAEEG